MIAKPTEVKALEKYLIFVSFDDGTQGVVDLQHLAHKGVFKAWDSNGLFACVHISDYGAITWNDDLDICPDSIWLQLNGLSFDEWKTQNKKVYA